MTTAQRPMNGGEWALLLFLSLLWGGSFFFVGVAVKALPPFTIVAARVSIAAALLWSTARLNGLSPRAVVAEAPALALLGLVNNAIPFALIVYGQTRLASGLAAILNAATPIFTVAFAHFVTKTERLTWPKLLGAALGVAGVAAMMGGDYLRAQAPVWAELAVLGAAATYACASIYGRRFRARALRLSTSQLVRRQRRPYTCFPSLCSSIGRGPCPRRVSRRLPPFWRSGLCHGSESRLTIRSAAEFPGAIRGSIRPFSASS